MSKHSVEGNYISEPYQYNVMVRLCEEARKMQDVDASEGIILARKGLELACELDDLEYQYQCGFTLGRCLSLQGKLDEGLEVLSETLHLVRENFSYDKEKVSLTTNAIGIIYYNKDNRELALDYFMKALKFQVKGVDLKIFNNLGNLYSVNGDYEKAKEYLYQGLDSSRSQSNDYMVNALLLNTVTSHIQLGELENAKENAYEALEVADRNIEEDKRFLHLKAHTLYCIGEIHIQEEAFGKALDVIDEGLRISEKQSSHVSYCMGLNLKAFIYFKMNSEEDAMVYVNRTLEFAEKYQLWREKKYVLESVVEYYEKSADFEKAYPFLKELQLQIKEEALESRKNNFKKIITDREREIELLESMNKEIGEQNLLLEQFAFIISHDLKEPIRNIVSFSSLLDKRYYHKLDEGGRQFLKYIIMGATNMNQNLTRLLQFTTLKRVEEVEVEKLDLPTLVQSLEKEYAGVIEPFTVNITFDDGKFNMIYDHAFALLDEVFSNAIQFRKNGMNCYIEVRMEEKEDCYHFSIKDYGIGIEQEYQKQIFRIFNRLNKQDYNGSGVGLAICKRIIKLYGGDIWIESEVGVFTTIHFTIPIKNKKIDLS